MLFWFWSDICRYITCQDFISPEPSGEGDILGLGMSEYETRKK
jgi:hypothetical protein